MRASNWIAAIASAVIGIGCATPNKPPPNRQLTDARTALRVAEKVGAPAQPQAATYFAVAREQIAGANREMARDNYEGAAMLLRRAQANAELAAALAREATARAEAIEMRRQVEDLKSRVR